MPGTMTEIDSVSNIAATTTTKLGIPQGGCSSMILMIDVIAVTGEWSIQAQWHAFNTTANQALGSLGTITATGLNVIPLGTGFTATRQAMPNPTTLVYTRTAGNLTAKVYMARSN